jgi:hypothetical protein
VPGAPLGIDTPERGACGFEQASKFARDTLLNQPVEVAPDPTQDNIDAYGRSLLYINVGYSVAVTRAGWAKHYIFNNNPVQKAPEIKAAQANSQQQQHVGIWVITNCATPAPAPAPTSEQAPPPPPSTVPLRLAAPARRHWPRLERIGPGTNPATAVHGRERPQCRGIRPDPILWCVATTSCTRCAAGRHTSHARQRPHTVSTKEAAR